MGDNTEKAKNVDLTEINEELLENVSGGAMKVFCPRCGYSANKSIGKGICPNCHFQLQYVH